MALSNFFRDTLLRVFIPKLQNSSVFASSNFDSKNSCDDSDQQNNNNNNSNDYKCESSDDQQSASSDDPRIIGLETPQDRKKKQLQRCRIVVKEPDNYCLISGVPIEVTCTRPARIHQTTKNAQQSGTRHLGQWLLDFDTKERWENPLMGWCSSGDAISNVQMRFATKEKAIDYCKKNSMKFRVDESKTRKKFKIASYALNFHYTKRTRVSTK